MKDYWEHLMFLLFGFPILHNNETFQTTEFIEKNENEKLQVLNSIHDYLKRLGIIQTYWTNHKLFWKLHHLYTDLVT